MISSDELLLALGDWNLWDRPIPQDLLGHPRTLTSEILATATGREVVAVVGVRRCGKTTILLQLMDALVRSGVDPKRVLYVNFEDHRLALHRELPLFDRVVAFHKEEVYPEGPSHLFLDEPQEVPGWERWVRSISDRSRSLRIYVTGSSSSLMSEELATLLTGRNLTFRAAPFSFTEFLGVRGVTVDRRDTPVATYKANVRKGGAINHRLVEYLERGGFAEAVGSTPPHSTRLLQQYFSDIIAKDVVRRHRLRDTSTVTDLAFVLMSNVANLVTYGRLGRSLGLSASVVRKLMGHLEGAQLVHEARFFSHSTNQTVSVQKPRKVYSVDPGLRNAVVASPTPDRGRLAENVVFNDLLARGLHPYYWREKGEVDFVVRAGSQVVPINVCFGDEVAPRELAALEMFNEKFHNRTALLITRNAVGERKVGAAKCTICPLWAWLLSTEPMNQVLGE